MDHPLSHSDAHKISIIIHVPISITLYKKVKIKLFWHVLLAFLLHRLCPALVYSNPLARVLIDFRKIINTTIVVIQLWTVAVYRSMEHAESIWSGLACFVSYPSKATETFKTQHSKQNLWSKQECNNCAILECFLLHNVDIIHQWLIQQVLGTPRDAKSMAKLSANYSNNQ